MTMERALIEHCSPTLANIKVGSLFCFLSPACHQVESEIERLNAGLRAKGLTLRAVKSIGERTLCYLYRSSQLDAMLADARNAAFLREHGYHQMDRAHVLTTLCSRLAQNPDFPHEIGLFLGYPLADVIGFIENKGKNCLCCGCWKAYTDICTAQRRFHQFAKCTQIYKRLYHSGSKTLEQLTVAA